MEFVTLAGYVYDALGRVVSTSTSGLGTVSYQYDAAGRRTRMTWPDGFFIDYDYSSYFATGDLRQLLENGGAPTGVELVGWWRDELGRPTRIVREPATPASSWSDASTDLGYDAAGRLSYYAHNLGHSGTSHDAAWSFGYNAAGQIASKSGGNAVYDWAAPGSASTSYTSNGLDQYTGVTTNGVSTTPTYDLRGNLTWDGSKRYCYDADNRLVGAGGASCEAPGASLAYDPAGRLAEVASGGAATRFLYDGDDVIAEYDASGAVLRRYVHGPGANEPLVWYEGAGTSDKRWLIADERGSVQAVMRADASVLAVNRYDAYGAPAAGNQGRFQYTGQMWLPEAGVYHFKARAYHPGLGRFLQTDPMGMAGGMNLYAYAGNDPVNRSDPSGLEPCAAEGCSELERLQAACVAQGGVLPEAPYTCADVWAVSWLSYQAEQELAANQYMAGLLLDALDPYGMTTAVAWYPAPPTFYGSSGTGHQDDAPAMPPPNAYGGYFSPVRWADEDLDPVSLGGSACETAYEACKFIGGSLLLDGALWLDVDRHLDLCEERFQLCEDTSYTIHSGRWPEFGWTVFPRTGVVLMFSGVEDHFFPSFSIGR